MKDSKHRWSEQSTNSRQAIKDKRRRRSRCSIDSGQTIKNANVLKLSTFL